jgi:hypothetical protein
MAQAFCSGPVPIYCGVGAGGSPLFLGHAERFPRVSIRPRFSSVYCDLSGQTVEYDSVYDGENSHVIADITRWNESTYAIIADRAKTRTAATVNRGTTGFGEIGTLMMTEGVAYPLYLVFPYAAKAAYATMPAGYQFFCAYLAGPDDFDLGSTARKLRLVFNCIRQVQAATGGTTVLGANNYGGMLQLGLYNNNVSACAGVPVT